MRFRSLFALIALLPLAAFTPAEEQAQGWTFALSKGDGAWEGAVSEVPAPVLPGKTAIRFVLRPGDCTENDCAHDRRRAEAKSTEHEREGEQRHYRWSFYLPPDFPDLWPTRVFIGQFHQEDSRPAMLFSLEPEGLRLDSQFIDGDKPLLIEASRLKGQWHSIEAEVLWSAGKGKLLIEADDMKVVDYEGPTLSTGQVYFKFGLYQAHLSRNPATAEFTQTVYFKDLARMEE